jgi:competence protein ComEC
MNRFLLTALLAFSLPSLWSASKTLDMWAIDTEGGKSLLLVSPSGQSMLVDTGFPGFNDRDANRIAEAVKDAGLTKVDVLVTTHYDSDHVGNVAQTVAKVPVDLFVDYGAQSEHGFGFDRDVAAYNAVWAKAKHLVVKPGDRIPFAGVDVLVVTANAEAIKTPVKGAGQPNPDCASVQRKTWMGKNEDVSENGHAVGMLFTFGTFKMLDLADITWNRELELMCPNNPIGTVDLLQVSHHGNDISSTPALINPLRARVMVVDDGPRKMALPLTMKTLNAAPGRQAIYMLHWSALAPNDNPPEEFIANLQSSPSPNAQTAPDGKWIKISADQDGTIVVTNGRTGEAKTYKR